MQDDFEYAIRHKLKVRFQMTDTPDGHWILFHPYAILENILLDEISVLGLMEAHHTDPSTNVIRRPKINGIRSVQILNDQHFVPNHDLWKKDGAIDFQIVNVLVEAQPVKS